MIETSSIEKKSAALLNDVEELTKKGLPIIINRYLLKVHEKALNDLQVDFYIQKEGPLCVLLDRTQDLEQLGFSPKYLTKSNFANAISYTPAQDIAQNLKKICLYANDNGIFSRLVAFCGHGIHPNPYENKDSGTIAALSTKEFQSAIDSLNPAFIVVSSCYTGGKNLHQIHFPDQTIRCPIVVSAFEYTVTSPTDSLLTSLLREVRKTIFGNRSGILPKQLLKRDMYRIMSGFPKQEVRNLHQILFPATHHNLPKVPHSLFSRNEAIHLDHKGPLHEHVRTFLFSKPIVDETITIKSFLPIAFISTGDTSQHLIREIHAPELELEAFADQTFNLFWSRYKQKEVASKAYFIAKLTCKVLDEPKTLHQVLIKHYPQTREFIFRIAGEDHFRRMLFTVNLQAKENWFRSGPDQLLSEASAFTEYFKAVIETRPSKKSLLARTAGQQSAENFLEALKALFWPESETRKIALLTAILHNPPIFYKSEDGSLSLHNTFKEALDALSIQPDALDEKEQEFLREAFDLAEFLNKPDLAKMLLDSAKTSLVKAIKNGDFLAVQTLIEQSPSSLHATNFNGYTPLFFATDKTEIAKFLIDKGAVLDHQGRFNNTPLLQATLNDNEDLISYMIQKGLDVKGQAGGYALKIAIQNNKPKALEFLLQHQAGIHSSYPLLWNAAVSSAPRFAFETLLDYPHQLDFPSEAQKNTTLHSTIFLGDVEKTALLLKKGANPNIKNSQGLSPLFFTIWCGKDKALEVLELMIEQGVEMNSQDPFGNTVLYFAIAKKNIPFVKRCVASGASLTVTNQYKLAPLDLLAEEPELLNEVLDLIDFEHESPFYPPILLHALLRDDLSLAKACLQRGANLNSIYLNAPLLFHYLKKENPSIDVLKFCLPQADLTLRDNEGNTLLHQATRTSLDIFKIVLDASPCLNLCNAKGETPLLALKLTVPRFQKRSLTSGVQKCSLLIEKLDEITYKELKKISSPILTTALARVFFDKYVFSNMSQQELNTNPAAALHHAIFYHDIEKIEQILKTQPAKTNFLKVPPIQAAFYLSKEKCEIIIPILLKYLSGWNKYDLVFPRPLQVAILRHPQLALLMIRDYAHELDLANRDGIDAYLHSDDETIKKLLIEKHVGLEAINPFLEQVIESKNVNHLEQIFTTYPDFPIDPIDPQDPFEHSLLPIAFQTDNPQIVDLVFSKKPNPNARCFVSGTPLHHLARYGKDLQNQLRFALQLIDNRADIDSLDSQNTPLHEALTRQNIPLAKLLIQKGANLHARNKEGKTAKELAEEYLLHDLVSLMKIKQI